MAERGISVQGVVTAVEHGDVIERYPDDTPYPSQLSVAVITGRPLHVCWATDPTTHKVVVITAYEPDPNRWEPDYRTRRRNP